jgi:site-specific DNA-cytosine methylase
MASLNKGEVNSIDDTLALTQATRPSTLVVFTDNTLSYDKFKFYLSQTIKSLNNLGYECHSYLLDTVDFGVAQKQDFSCIIATRIINPAPISIIPTTPRSQERVTVRQALKSLDQPAPLPPKHYAYSSHEIIKKYHKLVNKGGNYGHVFQQLRNSRTYTNWTKIDDQSPSFKLTTLPLLTHYLEPRFLTLKEYISLSSFPQDIRFDNEQVTNEDSQQTGKYLIGSSVPPFLALAVGKALKPLYIQTST